jgi:hypothetical protein
LSARFSRLAALALLAAIAACQATPPVVAPGTPAAMGGVAVSKAKRLKLVEALGKASFGGMPVTDATVTIRDAAGATVWRKEHATDAGGAFHVPVHVIEGKDVRVAVEGGKLDGKPFPVALGTCYDAYDAWLHILRVNGPTTVAARYLAAHPGTADQAIDAVKRYFGVTGPADLGLYMDLKSQRVFDAAAFRATAEATGNGDGSLSLQAAAAAGAPTSAFVPPPLYRLKADDSSLLSKLAVGVATSLLSAGAGNVLKSVWPGNPFVQHTSELDDVKSSLDQLTTSVNDISTKLTTLSNSLQSLSDRLAGVSAQLNELSIQNDYNQVRGAFATKNTALVASKDAPATDIGQKYAHLYNYLDAGPMSQAEWTHFTDLQNIDDLEGDMSSINSLLVGSAGDPGLIELWHHMVGYNALLTGATFPGAADRAFLDNIRKQFAYFSQLQTEGLLLISNLCLAQDTPLYNRAWRAAQLNMQNLQAQQRMIFGYDLTEGTLDNAVLLPAAGEMWTRSPIGDVSYTGVNGTSALDLGIGSTDPLQLLKNFDYVNPTQFQDWVLPTSAQYLRTIKPLVTSGTNASAAFFNLGFINPGGASLLWCSNSHYSLPINSGPVHIPRKYQHAAVALQADVNAFAERGILDHQTAWIYLRRDWERDPFIDKFTNYFPGLPKPTPRPSGAPTPTYAGATDWDDALAALGSNPVTGSPTPSPDPNASPTPTPTPTPVPTPTPTPVPTPTPDTKPPEILDLQVSDLTYIGGPKVTWKTDERTDWVVRWGKGSPTRAAYSRALY